jgi:lysophospholipase L1-like esterase
MDANAPAFALPPSAFSEGAFVGGMFANSGAGGGGDSPVLLLSLDASSLVLANNDPVALWPDDSGNARDVANATNRPVYKSDAGNGLPGVSFNGSAWLENSVANLPANAGRGLTVLVVGKRVGGAGGPVLTLRRSTKYLNTGLLTYAGTHYVSGDGVNTEHNQIIANMSFADNWFVCAWRYLGAESATDIFANGVLKSITAGTQGFETGSTGFQLGKNASGQFWNGYLSNVIVYDRALYDSILNSEASALAAEYGQSWTTVSTSHGVPGALQKRIIFDGNSLTRGYGASDAAHSYPSVCFTLLSGYDFGGNCGVDSQTTTQMTADGVAQIDPRIINPFTNTVLEGSVVVAFEGTNQAANGTPVATNIANFKTYCQARRNAGAIVVAGTWPKNGYYPALDADRLTYNAEITNGANIGVYWDAVVNFDSDARLMNPANATYFQGDQLHYTDAGYAVIAELVAAVVNAL